MVINLTFLVQAGNFFIAYLMIRILLLKPALICIREDKQAYDAMLIKIAAQKEKLEFLEKRIIKRWYVFQQTFLKREPTVVRAEELFVTIVPGMPEFPPLDPSKIQQLVDDVSHQLVEKVANVY